MVFGINSETNFNNKIEIIFKYQTWESTFLRNVHEMLRRMGGRSHQSIDQFFLRIFSTHDRISPTIDPFLVSSHLYPYLSSLTMSTNIQFYRNENWTRNFSTKFWFYLASDWIFTPALQLCYVFSTLILMISCALAIVRAVFYKQWWQLDTWYEHDIIYRIEGIHFD